MEKENEYTQEQYRVEIKALQDSNRRQIKKLNSKYKKSLIGLSNQIDSIDKTRPTNMNELELLNISLRESIVQMENFHKH